MKESSYHISSYKIQFLSVKPKTFKIIHPPKLTTSTLETEYVGDKSEMLVKYLAVLVTNINHEPSSSEGDFRKSLSFNQTPNQSDVDRWVNQSGRCGKSGRQFDLCRLIQNKLNRQSLKSLNCINCNESSFHLHSDCILKDYSIAERFIA